jgi:signal transduction histidine kinase
MERAVRIAVVGPVDDRLPGDLRGLPLHPEVRVSASLCADSEALSRFQPDVLVIAFEPGAAEEIGALRLLRNLWPALAVVLVCRAEDELANTALAARLHARLATYPSSPGELAAAIEQARQHSDRPHADVFVDLARGIADEINNPLMFVSGHLQLLRATFDTARDRDRRDQIAAAQHGLQAIASSVDRLRQLSQAANGPRRRESVDVGALVSAAVAARENKEPPLATIAPAPGAFLVQGDPEQLQGAIAAVVQFADDLARLGAESQLSLETLPGGHRLRLVAAGQSLAIWQLPHTFEPYYPTRALRGHGYGLGLFLAQTVVLGHHGQATVQRQHDGSLQFDFALPA